MWRDAPASASLLLSRLSGRKYWAVTISDTTVRLGFITSLHHAIAKAEHEGRIEKDILEHWLKIEGRVVYDIGGYNGLYGILYAKKYPQSSVTIFEPDAINYNQILHNIQLNGLTNCMVEKVAISDKEGTLQFSQGGRSKERIVESGGNAVPTFPLSHYPKADLLKIDVEGAEGKVLKGLNYLSNIVLELHNQEMLAQYGDTQEGILNRAKELHLTPVLLSDRDSEKHYLLQK